MAEGGDAGLYPARADGAGSVMPGEVQPRAAEEAGARGGAVRGDLEIDEILRVVNVCLDIGLETCAE